MCSFPTKFKFARIGIYTLGLILFLIALQLMYGRRRYLKYLEISKSNINSINPYLVISNRGPDLDSLPNLSSIIWPYTSRPNFTGRTTGKYFDLSLSQGQYDTYKKLLSEFQKVMISLKLQDQWFLTSGSLLGSLRHHDMIPWDDDMDVCANIQHRSKIQSALKNLSSEFAMASQTIRDKLFFKPIDEASYVNASTIGSFRIPGFPWSWPFLDISYYKRTGANTAHEIFGRGIHLDLTQIFPVTYRPFGDQWYPAPRNPINMLKTYYSTNDLCVSPYYSHALERSIRSERVDCALLLKIHPFIQRCPCPSSSNNQEHDLECCDEYLVDGYGKVIHKIRTLLHSNEIHSPKFTAINHKFTCP